MQTFKFKAKWKEGFLCGEPEPFKDTACVLQFRHFFKTSSINLRFFPTNGHICGNYVGIVREHSRVKSSHTSDRGTPSLPRSGASPDSGQVKASSTCISLIFLWWCLGHYYLNGGTHCPCVYLWFYVCILFDKGNMEQTKQTGPHGAKSVYFTVVQHLSDCFSHQRPSDVICFFSYAILTF